MDELVARINADGGKEARGGLQAVGLGVFLSLLAAIFIDALCRTRNLIVALMAVPASLVMLCSYGWGFLKAFVWKIVLRHGRDEQQEIAMRKGK